MWCGGIRHWWVLTNGHPESCLFSLLFFWHLQLDIDPGVYVSSISRSCLLAVKLSTRSLSLTATLVFRPDLWWLCRSRRLTLMHGIPPVSTAWKSRSPGQISAESRMMNLCLLFILIDQRESAVEIRHASREASRKIYASFFRPQQWFNELLGGSRVSDHTKGCPNQRIAELTVDLH